MKTLMRFFLCIALFLGSTLLQAQPSVYRWTGAVNNLWSNNLNWVLESGPGVSYQKPVTITCIAKFDNTSNVNCTIDGNYLPNGGLYVGGLEINGYTGTITQGPTNRFLISDCPSMNGCPYNNTYQAIFNFGPGGKFIGSNTTILAGTQDYEDNYTMAIGVELHIIGGDFYAPRKLLMENSVEIIEGPNCNFYANGFYGTPSVVTFYPRPSGTAPPFLVSTGNASFYDLQLFGAPVVDFLGNNNVTVANNLITYGGGVMRTNNGSLHVKRNVIIKNTDLYAYANGTPGGTATIVLDGTVSQQIIKTSTETAGPLPRLTINNPAGVVISGKISVGGLITFQNGIITPLTSGTNDVLVALQHAAVTGANDLSYVEATVRKHALNNAIFEFPVGKNGEYHPIKISNVSGGAGATGSTNSAYYNQFTAEYFDSSTPNTANVGAGVYNVHNCEYWSLQRNNLAGSNARVYLSWNSQSCDYPSYFSLSSDIRVAQYDGANWVNRGAGTIGTYLPSGNMLPEATGFPSSQFVGSTPTLFTFSHATPMLSASITSSTNVTCNGGNDGTATVTASGGTGTLLYSWNTSPVQTSATAVGLAAGTYIATVTDGTGASATATVTITEPAPIVINFPPMGPYCSSNYPVLLNSATPAGGVYSGSFVTFSSGNYYFDPNVAGAGNFPVTYTYTDGSGCTAVSTITVTVDPGPQKPLGFEWAKEPSDLGGSSGNDIDVDNTSGNVYSTGSFTGTVNFDGIVLNSAGGQDVYVLCEDNNGNAIWAKSFGGSSDDYGTGITVTSAGNLSVSGYYWGVSTFGATTLTSIGMQDAFVAGLDAATGNALWAQSIGGTLDDQANAISTDGANTYIAGYIYYGSSGQTVSFGSGVTVTGLYAGSFVAKYDNAGTCLWAVKGGYDWQKASALSVSSTGRVVVGGYRVWDTNYFLETYDATGNFWYFNSIEAHPTGTYDYLAGIGGIDQDIVGNIYVTGVYSDGSGSSTAIFNQNSITTPAYLTAVPNMTLNGGVNEVYIAKYDPQLNLINAVNAGLGNAYAPFNSIAVADDGTTYITGAFTGTFTNLCFSMSNFGYDDIFILVFDDSQNFLWGQKPDGGYYEFNPDITIDNSGNVYMTGNMYGYSVDFASINLAVSNGYNGTAFTTKLSSSGSSFYRKGMETVAEMSEEVLSAYPNPFAENVNIVFTEKENSNYSLGLFDLNGNLVAAEVAGKTNSAGKQLITMDLKDLPDGVYMARLTTSTGTKMLKLIHAK
jgi:hypothetical protein